LTPVGSITPNPERQPSAQRIAAIRKKIVDNNALCIFSEPQFEPSIVKTLIEGMSTKVGVLDADGGVGIAPGPDAYFTIMRNLGDSLKGCLAAPN
jgi:zinc transport system substrate-binding protein